MTGIALIMAAQIRPGRATISNRTVSKTVASGTTSAAVTFGTDGSLTLSGNSTTVLTTEWFDVQPMDGSAYEGRWTNTSGAISIGTAGVFENLGTARQYGRSTAANSTATCTGTYEIRRPGGDVIASASITLTATSTGP